jgi:hypothetical protein
MLPTFHKLFFSFFIQVCCSLSQQFWGILFYFDDFREVSGVDVGQVFGFSAVAVFAAVLAAYVWMGGVFVPEP